MGFASRGKTVLPPPENGSPLDVCHLSQDFARTAEQAIFLSRAISPRKLPRNRFSALFSSLRLSLSLSFPAFLSVSPSRHRCRSGDRPTFQSSSQHEWRRGGPRWRDELRADEKSFKLSHENLYRRGVFFFFFFFT